MTTEDLDANDADADTTSDLDVEMTTEDLDANDADADLEFDPAERFDPEPEMTEPAEAVVAAPVVDDAAPAFVAGGPAEAEVQLPDGARGIWKTLRVNSKSLRTGPDNVNSYAIVKLDAGALMCVVDETESGWCQVRLLGPDLSEVRGLLKAQPGMIELDGDTASVVRGSHEVRAPSLVSRGGIDGVGDPDPLRSYIPFGRIEPGTSVAVIRTFEDRTGELWYEVVPPQDASGWIHSNYLEDPADDSLPFLQGTDEGGRPRFVLGPADRVDLAAEPEVTPAIESESENSGEPENVEAIEVVIETSPDGGVAIVAITEIEDVEEDEVVETTEVEDVEEVDVMDDTTVEVVDQPEVVEVTEIEDVEEVEVVETTEVEEVDEVDAMDDTTVEVVEEPEVVEVTEIEDVEEAEVVETTEVEDVEDPEAVETTEVEDVEEADAMDDTTVEVVEDVRVVEEPEVVHTPEVDLIDDDMQDVSEITLESEPEPEPEPEPAPILSAEILAGVTLADAESKYEEIRSSPENDSEFEAMELIYLTISERPTTNASERSRAEVRLRQIRIQRDLQKRIDTLRRLESRAKVDRERIEAIREALLDRADYTAIGRLSRSRVYDGRTLPLLYRLEDPASGRTITYVQPDSTIAVEAGLGRIVGIVGVEREDTGYRIRIIKPERFEIDLTEEIDAN